jgi:hypothetical protein
MGPTKIGSRTAADNITRNVSLLKALKAKETSRRNIGNGVTSIRITIKGDSRNDERKQSFTTALVELSAVENGGCEQL